MLIPCGSSASVAAKRQATPTLPIVFLNVGNPIAMGLVENLSHPNGNATGFSDILADLGDKLVELGRELSKPHATVAIFGIQHGRTGKIGFRRRSRLPNQPA